MKISELVIVDEGRKQTISTDIINAVKNSYQKEDGTIRSTEEIAYIVFKNNDISSLKSVEYILKKYYKDRPRKIQSYSEEEIKQVKQLYDEGLSFEEIAQHIYGVSKTSSSINKAIRRVESILLYHYPDREIRKVKEFKFSQAEIENTKKLFDQGLPAAEIATQVFGQDPQAYNKVKALLYRLYPDRVRRVTDMSDGEVQEAIKLFLEGNPFSTIATKLERSSTAISDRIRQEPNYEEELLSVHMQKRERLAGVSVAEIDYFKTLQSYPDMIPLERNKNIHKPSGKNPYNCDAVNEARKIIIEFYGDRWHANPTLYPDASTPISQITAAEIREKDKIKEEFLTSKGYTVCVIWERDWKFKQTRLNTINKARRALGLDNASRLP